MKKWRLFWSCSSAIKLGQQTAKPGNSDLPRLWILRKGLNKRQEVFGAFIESLYQCTDTCKSWSQDNCRTPTCVSCVEGMCRRRRWPKDRLFAPETESGNGSYLTWVKGSASVGHIKDKIKTILKKLHSVRARRHNPEG